jgi:serine protease
VAIERRASALGQGDLGPAYVLVLNADDPARTIVAQEAVSTPSGGTYSYTVAVPGTAAVSLIAGSDLDNNGVICSAGEACGGYPMLSRQLEVLRPDGNLSGIDFTLAPYGGISAVDVRR